jgi:hypothetical protein
VNGTDVITATSSPFLVSVGDICRLALTSEGPFVSLSSIMITWSCNPAKVSSSDIIGLQVIGADLNKSYKWSASTQGAATGNLTVPLPLQSDYYIIQYSTSSLHALITSPIFGISGPNATLIISSKLSIHSFDTISQSDDVTKPVNDDRWLQGIIQTTVSGWINVEWRVNQDVAHLDDWIGLYYLGQNAGADLSSLNGEASSSSTATCDKDESLASQQPKIYDPHGDEPMSSLGASIWWRSTNGALRGSFNIMLPTNAGSYVLRYFKQGGYSSSAISPIIILTAPNAECLAKGQSRSNIKHVIVICTENHSFDSYFGNYCQAPTGWSHTQNLLSSRMLLFPTIIHTYL